MKRMRRLLPVLALVAAVGFTLLATGALDDSGGVRYKLQLDNSYGLTEGSDVRVAGVRAGIVEKMRLDRKRMVAEIQFELTERGFGDLRRDVTCETRPQSLIGEYFIDCDPGKSSVRLEEGDTIPVRQSSSVVPPDLVANIMRRPYRERFSILLSQLGQGLAGRGEDLNETIRRANPALREVNKVLKVLAQQRRTIRDLYTDADTIFSQVVKRRRDVGRFVQEARDTTRAYATEAASVDDQFRQLPTFLGELQPTLAALEGTAEAQRPAFESLRVSARPLAALLRTTGNFSTASRPSVRALAALARSGEGNLERSLPNLKRLTSATRRLPETAGNLGIILNHLNDRDFAAERDPRSPGGRGYTGLEAFLRFLWLSSQTSNWFDKDSYLLKNAQYGDEVCGKYVDAETVKKSPRRCRAWLGPNQPGVTSADPTKGSTVPPPGEEEEATASQAKSSGAAAKSAGAGDEPLLDFLLR